MAGLLTSFKIPRTVGPGAVSPFRLNPFAEVITGASVDDELLDRIFRDFCIGK